MLILFLFCNSNSNILYQNFNSHTQINDWGLNQHQCTCNCLATISVCNAQSILKINQCDQAYEYNILIYKTFELNPHYEISLFFKFWRIDEWNNYQFYVYVDYQIIHQATYFNNQGTNNLCEDDLINDETYLLSKTLEHSSPTVTIVIVSQKGTWGISDFELQIEECPPGCNFCNNKKCFDYKLIIAQFVQKTISTVSILEGWSYNNLVQTSASFCIDFFFHYVSGTHLVKEISLNRHSNISFQIKIIIRNSSPTEINVKIDENVVYTTQYNEGWIKFPAGLCQYISLKSILIMDYIHSSSSVKIKVQGNNNVQLIGIRDFQLFINENSNEKEICMDKNINAFDGCFAFNYDCVEGCKNCIKGVCLDCLIGWEYKINEQYCYPICGDQIITQLEECDDGNTIPYDGCHQCFYSCPLFCLQCIFGQCFQCDSQYQLSLNKKQCLSIYNDDIMTPYKLQNDILFEEYYNQNQNCQIECQLCIYNQCILCLEGWILRDNKCYQQCGDGMVALSSIEQCDDGNQIENDGCFQCQFQCIPNCFSCINNNNCFICNDYFQLENNLCQPICGDGVIINGFEECDDGNNYPLDGCYQCKFQCSDHCILCEKENYCSQCDNLTILDNITMQCIQLNREEQTLNQEIKIQTDINNQNQISDLIHLCGDGTINSQNEQCDDGNTISLDGCSNQCEIEKDWSCLNQLKHSQCFINTSFTLTLLKNKNQIQYVQLSFTNKVRLKESTQSFLDNLRYFIYDIPSKLYYIKVKEVISIDQFILNYPIYEFEIRFYESQINQPILKVSINASLLDYNNFQLENNEKSLNLQIPNILTEFQMATAIKLYTFSFWMMIGLGSGSFLLLIFGDIASFTEILDILQYQSYLKYINVNFPDNVLIYFESSEIVTIAPILNTLKVTPVFDKLIGENHIDSVNKLYEYNLNADLLINIYGQIIQIIICLIIYFLITYLSKYIQNCFSPSCLSTRQNCNNKFIEWIIIKSFFFFEKLKQFGSSLNFKETLLQIFYANSWDLIFKVFNYLVSKKNYEIRIRTIISNILSIVWLIIVVIILISNFQRQKSMMKLKELRYQQHEVIILLKKLIFLIVLICIQSEPIFQCVMLSTLILCYIGLIKIIKFTSVVDVIFIIWLQAPVMIFTLISLAYCHEFQRYITTDVYFQLGFIQISILIFGLFGPLIKCGILCYHNAKKLFPKKKQIEKAQEIKIFTQP
ncbi:unnamed protein product [Paramecium sonneborni]|uniref:Uncharacterized protein n=1 Tax=Paramecium sonneborni TaxID=65129 RepID=A0A8S1R198_9CILI|nr:unnamed protein product [Paramecium sonneborni]